MIADASDAVWIPVWLAGFVLLTLVVNTFSQLVTLFFARQAAKDAAAAAKELEAKKEADAKAVEEKALMDAELAKKLKTKLEADKVVAEEKAKADEIIAQEKAAAEKEVADAKIAAEKAIADKVEAVRLAVEEKARTDRENAERIRLEVVETKKQLDSMAKVGISNHKLSNQRLGRALKSDLAKALRIKELPGATQADIDAYEDALHEFTEHQAQQALVDADTIAEGGIPAPPP